VTTERDPLREQIQYYRARAGEYDQWFLRQGRYDRGEANRRAWFDEAATVERALHAELDEFDGRHVLELACGTGLWTRHLAAPGRRVVALDASPEVIAINRGRVTAGPVDYVIGDIFAPPLAGQFDLVFFAFWLSHVPQTRFDEFWLTVGRRLRPGGKVFVVDSLLDQESSAVDHDPLDTSGVSRRKLNDGRQFDVVKVFHEPSRLEHRLSASGWRGWIRASGRFFLYGSLCRNGS